MAFSKIIETLKIAAYCNVQKPAMISSLDQVKLPASALANQSLVGEITPTTNLCGASYC